MTQEEKAKAYDEALEQAKFYHENCPSEPERKKLEKMFPVLSESEDERIRRTLVEYFGPQAQLDFVRGIPIQKIRDWLEKQKEQKELPLMGGDTDSYFDDLRMTTKPLTSREWFDEGMKYAQMLQKEQKPLETPSPSVIYTEQGEVLAEQKPAWSEEDEKRIKQLIYNTEHIRAEYEKRKDELGECFNDKLIKDCDEQITWLKSLRPDTFQNGNSRPKTSDNWKPSEEHLSALLAVFNDPNNIGSQTCQLALTDLYEQLKKL